MLVASSQPAQRVLHVLVKFGPTVAPRQPLCRCMSTQCPPHLHPRALSKGSQEKVRGQPPGSAPTRLSSVARRGALSFSLLLLVGTLVVSPVGHDVSAPSDSPRPVSDANLSISAIAPAITPATSKHAGEWRAGRRDQQRSYSRPWAATASLAVVAFIFVVGVLRVTPSSHGRFLTTGRTSASRAPPAPALA